MPDLYHLILASAWAGLNMQSANGMMPPGHNGPYHDPETPVRNTSHWLIIFAKAYDISGEISFRVAASQAAEYLVSSEARPEMATFWHRQNPQKDGCNGLIGQAWTLEALITAAKMFDRIELVELAREVFLLHPFNEGLGLWQRVEVDGRFLSIDPTLNHQVWFAAVGSLLSTYFDNQITFRVERFMDRLQDHLTTYPSGLIYHPLTINTLGFKMLINRLKLLRQSILWRHQLIYKAIGYHAFNLYAMALLKQHYPVHSFWSSVKFKTLWNYALSEEYKYRLNGNKFGYPYNPAGLEMAFSLEIFADNTRLEQQGWLSEQLCRCYNFESHLMNRNTEDPMTHAARFYEATRLPNMAVTTGD